MGAPSTAQIILKPMYNVYRKYRFQSVIFWFIDVIFLNIGLISNFAFLISVGYIYVFKLKKMGLMKIFDILFIMM